MALKAMIFTSDRSVSKVFAAAVAELPLDWALVDDLHLAKQFIQRDPFDFLLIDITAERATNIIKEARTSELNQSCVIFAISRRPADERLRQLGADVYLRKPCDLNALSSRLHEELPLINHERRWSRRCPVKINIVVHRKSQRFSATVLNLSEGGMRIKLRRHIEDYDILKFSIVPPGSKRLLLHGKIVWRGAELTAGIRFLGLTNEEKRLLSDWVQSQPLTADQISTVQRGIMTS